MNFLTSLIQRHLPVGDTQLPVLQPRLPSRFESPSQHEPTGQTLMLDEVERIEQVAEAIKGERVDQADAPAFARSESLRSDLRQPSLEPALNKMTPARDTHVNAIQFALDSARNTIRSNSGSPEPAVTAENETPQAHMHPLGTHQPVTMNAPSSVAPPTKPALRPWVRTKSAFSVAPRSQTESARDASRERERLAPSEPTVHVTIGRVEVRAVMPDAPRATPARPAPQPNTPALEDYLRGRSGAGNKHGGGR